MRVHQRHTDAALHLPSQIVQFLLQANANAVQPVLYPPIDRHESAVVNAPETLACLQIAVHAARYGSSESMDILVADERTMDYLVRYPRYHRYNPLAPCVRVRRPPRGYSSLRFPNVGEWGPFARQTGS